jgi:hypothetical protein
MKTAAMCKSLLVNLNPYPPTPADPILARREKPALSAGVLASLDHRAPHIFVRNQLNTLGDALPLLPLEHALMGANQMQSANPWTSAVPMDVAALAKELCQGPFSSLLILAVPTRANAEKNADL